MAAKRHGRVLQTNAIAIVFPAPSDRAGSVKRTDPYFLPLFEAVELAAQERGIEVILCPARSELLPTIVSSTELDGIVDLFLSTEHKAMLLRLGMPIVTLNSRQEDMNSVEPNEREGTRLAVTHLASLGHTRIAYLGHPTSFYVGAERYAGYRDGLAQCGLPYDPLPLKTWMFAVLR